MPKILSLEEYRGGGCKITIRGTQKSDIDYVRSAVGNSEAAEGGGPGQSVLVFPGVSVQTALVRVIADGGIEIRIVIGRDKELTMGVPKK